MALWSALRDRHVSDADYIISGAVTADDIITTITIIIIIITTTTTTTTITTDIFSDIHAGRTRGNTGARVPVLLSERVCGPGQRAGDQGGPDPRGQTAKPSDSRTRRSYSNVNRLRLHPRIIRG